MTTAALLTPRTPGAIAIIQIEGDIDAALESIGVRPLRVGERTLTDLCHIDRGIAVRWSESCAQLLPHGGPAVVRGLLSAIEARGIPINQDASGFPEANDGYERRALGAVARAASPGAINRLLRQPDAWRAWDGVTPTPGEVDRHSRILNRLIDPPTVVAVGRPNIGKSALLNAMAGDRLALVADMRGVTRDHVGVSLRLGSGAEAVEVRWIDTPGLGAEAPTDELEQAAARSAHEAIRSADGVLLCADSTSDYVNPASLPIRTGAEVRRIGLRSDLGRCQGCDIETSATSGEGLADLAGLLKDSLFPAESMDWEGPWRFDEDLEHGR